LAAFEWFVLAVMHGNNALLALAQGGFDSKNDCHDTRHAYCGGYRENTYYVVE